MTRSALRRLARRHGLMPTYHGADRRIHTSPDEALIGALRALGLPIEAIQDAPDLERAARLARWSTVLEPVVTVWRGRIAVCPLRLPDPPPATLAIAIDFENGDGHAAEIATAGLERIRVQTVEGRRFARFAAPLPADLPFGYHRLRVRVGRDEHAALLLVAPERCAPIRDGATALFAPLYALRTARSPDCADFEDWRRFSSWASRLGISHVGSLPLCAQFLDPPVDAGPYAPVSRVFWNEVYLDLDGIAATAAHAPGAAADPRHVDWAAVAADRLARLQDAADRHFASEGPDGSDDLRAFVAARPEASRYARFRAAEARHGRNWRDWPAALRAGRLAADDVDERLVRRHLFAQWLCDRQIRRLDERSPAGLYLDLPVGVHPDGFDAWRYQDALLDGCSAGAPPDPFFTGGQSWGFPPVDPHGSRSTGHLWFRDCLRHQFEHCSLLRIDHVMGLNRIWLIPPGLEATDGCYLAQPADELFAIVTIESNRRGCAVVGEDLGTVPEATAHRLARHGLGSMQVFQFGLEPGRPERGAVAPAHGLIALNTHDMPSFAAFWAGDEIADRERDGRLDAEEARRERDARATMRDEVQAWLGRRRPGLDADDPRAILDALLGELARSDAAILVIGLEDLWLERDPQNVPGTLDPLRNWCRRTAPTLEEIVSDDDLARRLRHILEERDRHGETPEAPARRARQDPGT